MVRAIHHGFAVSISGVFLLLCSDFEDLSKKIRDEGMMSCLFKLSFASDFVFLLGPDFRTGVFKRPHRHWK